MLDVVIVGVGGQGTVSIGHLLGKACLKMNIPFVSSETHGMSQRGGSVIFHFRLGNKTAPLIPKGKADVIIAGEPMEALRFIEYLKPNGIILSNTQTIISPVALQLGMKYPKMELIWDKLRKWPSTLHKIDTSEIAKSIGMIQSSNIVLLGAFIGLNVIPVDLDTIAQIISERWPKVSQFNRKALLAGYNAINQVINVAN